MKNISIVIVMLLAMFLIVTIYWDRPSGKWINCRDVDFLPDVPPEVRAECRKIIKDRLDQQRNQEQERTKVRT
jgi:hypothetical protein